MLIRLVSDLHLEIPSPFIPPPMPEDSDTVLVLAGDIHNGSRAVPWIRALASRFKAIVYVLGNHEYWKDHLIALPMILKRAFIGTNVYVLQNDTAVIDNTRFIGGTLWTDFGREDPLSMLNAREIMRDYDRIRTGCYQKIKPEQILIEHKKTKAFIIDQLSQPFDGASVVVTHHGCAPESVHPKYYFTKGNEYYQSDLSGIMLDYKPKLWLHGHTHESRDYVIDQTRVVVNPYGYHGYEVNSSFDSNLRLEV